MLNLVHFTYVSHSYTHRRHSHPRAGAGAHIQMRPSLLSLPALKALGAACLPFTVTAVCVCLCVCRSEEGDIACQVLSRAKLSFLSVITPSYFPGAGCLSFRLSLSLSLQYMDTHTHTLRLSHRHTHLHTLRRSSRQC